MHAEIHLRHFRCEILSGSFPLAAIDPHALGSEETEGAVYLIRNGVEPVMYRRPFIARRPATVIMSHCSWSIQLSHDRAPGFLPDSSVRHEVREGRRVEA